MATLSAGGGGGGGRGREEEEKDDGKGGKRPRVVIDLSNDEEEDDSKKPATSSKESSSSNGGGRRPTELPILPFYLNKVWMFFSLCPRMPLWLGRLFIAMAQHPIFTHIGGRARGAVQPAVPLHQGRLRGGIHDGHPGTLF